MSNGYIKLHRQLKDWEWYTDGPVKTLFLHFLLSANYKEKRWRGYVIPRGYLITGREKLSVETGLSEMQIRLAMKKLIKTGEISVRATNKFSVVKINKFDMYQAVNSDVNTRVEFSENKPDNQQITTTKKEKNNAKLINYNTTILTDGIIRTKDDNMRWNLVEKLIRTNGSEQDCRLVDIFNFLDRHIKNQSSTASITSELSIDNPKCMELAQLYTKAMKKRYSAKNRVMRSPENYMRCAFKEFNGTRGKWDIDEMFQITRAYIRGIVEPRARYLGQVLERNESKEKATECRNKAKDAMCWYEGLPDDAQRDISEKAVSAIKSEMPNYSYRDGCLLFAGAILELRQAFVD